MISSSTSSPSNLPFALDSNFPLISPPSSQLPLTSSSKSQLSFPFLFPFPLFVGLMGRRVPCSGKKQRRGFLNWSFFWVLELKWCCFWRGRSGQVREKPLLKRENESRFWLWKREKASVDLRLFERILELCLTLLSFGGGGEGDKPITFIMKRSQENISLLNGA